MQPLRFKTQEILARIRERAVDLSAREQPGPEGAEVVEAPEMTEDVSLLVVPQPSLYETQNLQAEVGRCCALHNAVGELNPRGSGLHNRFLQLLKKVHRRSLTWYTRPLHQFHAAVTRVAQESSNAIQNLQQIRRSDQEFLIRLQRSHRALEHRTEVHKQYIEELQLSHRELARSLSQSWAEMQREILASADAPYGPKAAEGLHFHQAVDVSFDGSGRAFWRQTSGRIIENAWVLKELSGFSENARILNVDCAESTLALELASIGFLVTGIDNKPYPLRHPNLTFMQGELLKSPLPSLTFDAAIFLSAFSAIQNSVYENTDVRLEMVMNSLWRMLKPSGIGLVTLPFGKPSTSLAPIFNIDNARAIFSKLTIRKIEFGIRENERTWRIASEAEAAACDQDFHTGMPNAVLLARVENTKPPESSAK
jgi:2-polyprenyl-3-methyl-5-hydroxy-6-metoxy-1,4-benzoquinol methylase